MGGTKSLKNCTLLLSITLTLLCGFLLSFSMATVYFVGDQDEWNSQTDYASWAEGNNFTLGDLLVFKYVKGQHNVYEVSEESFRSCDTSNGVLAKYESGKDEVELKKVKKYWFICNIAGHCLGGMRFGIDVKQRTNLTHHASNFSDHALTPHNNIEPTPSYNNNNNSSISFELLLLLLLLLVLLFNVDFY
ncbi:hypothetical protein AAHE18_09G207700 [Arachis hypogaea]|nr:mavicyanin [Arachis hypogaea]